MSEERGYELEVEHRPEKGHWYARIYLDGIYLDTEIEKTREAAMEKAAGTIMLMQLPTEPVRRYRWTGATFVEAEDGTVEVHGGLREVK